MNRKAFIFYIILGFFSLWLTLGTAGATDHSGPVCNEIWKAVDNPHYIIGNVTVANGCFLEIEPDVESFISWGLTSGRIRKEVIACLRLFPELLVSPPSREIKPSANPRVWEFASQCLDANFPPALVYDSLVSCIGETAGSQLFGMITVFKNLPSVTSIVKNPGAVDIPSNPSSLHALCTVLAKFLEKKPEKVGPVFKFANRLPGDFSVCLIRDSLALCPELADTEAMEEWTANNVDLFI